MIQGIFLKGILGSLGRTIPGHHGYKSCMFCDVFIVGCGSQVDVEGC